jgi:hypothetical protein
MNNEIRPNWGKAALMNGDKVPLGRSCHKNLIAPADLSVSGPQPL